MRCRWSACVDDPHDEIRLVELNYDERFMIVRALRLLRDACETIGDSHRLSDVADVMGVFCEENWLPDRLPYTSKVRKIAKENEQ